MLSRFSHVWFCDPMDCSPPGSSVHRILKARILEWVAIFSSTGSSRPRDPTHVSYVSGIDWRVLYHLCHHLDALLACLKFGWSFQVFTTILEKDIAVSPVLYSAFILLEPCGRHISQMVSKIPTPWRAHPAWSLRQWTWWSLFPRLGYVTQLIFKNGEYSECAWPDQLSPWKKLASSWRQAKQRFSVKKVLHCQRGSYSKVFCWPLRAKTSPQLKASTQMRTSILKCKELTFAPTSGAWGRPTSFRWEDSQQTAWL